MRTRENDPSLKNKSCDVRSFDLADFDDESRGAALEQIERHHARIKEQKRILDALKEVKEIKADTPGSPYPAGDGVGPNALGKVVVGEPQGVDPRTGKPVDGDGQPGGTAFGSSAEARRTPQASISGHGLARRSGR